MSNTPLKFKNKKSIYFSFYYFIVTLASSFWAWFKVYRSKGIACYLLNSGNTGSVPSRFNKDTEVFQQT